MAILAVCLVFLLLLRDLDASDSLWCYECGTGVAGAPDCEAFARASSWQIFWRDCPKDSICVKTLPAWHVEGDSKLQLERDTVRGCSPRASHRGVIHQEGCWSHPSASHTRTCFCATNLCNAAHTPAAPPLPLTLVALCAVLLR